MLQNNTEVAVEELNGMPGLTSIEKDTIGEIMNISMSAAATAISNMLNKKVVITTPEVTLENTSHFQFNEFEPAVCTEVHYLAGLSGSNYMIMKRRDVKAMVRLILNDEGPDDGSFDEMHLSAVGEIMNQMMGSSSTALASFFGNPISISIPNVFELNQIYSNIEQMGFTGNIVFVKFHLYVEDTVDSEFVTLLPLDFTKELVEKAMNVTASQMDMQAETAATTPQTSAASAAPAPASAPAQAAPVSSGQSYGQAPVNIKPVKLQSFDDQAGPYPSEPVSDNMDLIMDVPLEITVEIGRTKKPVKEILELRQGSLIELNHQAGDPVDIIVNGQLIARGDVVVIDDNFGVRITEIIDKRSKEGTNG